MAAPRENMPRGAAFYSLNSDNMGDLTVAVYRARTDSVWRDTTAVTRDKVGISGNEADLLYGSYVFYTVAGSTYIW